MRSVKLVLNERSQAVKNDSALSMNGEEMQRHLIYYVCPLRVSDESWQFNLRELTDRMDCFTGRKIVAIGTGEECHDSIEIRKYFPSETEFLEFPNDPIERESVAFQDLVESVIVEEGITFFGHSKGVSHHRVGDRTAHPHVIPAAKLWAQANYDALLSCPGLIDDIVQEKWFVSLFVRHGHFKIFGPIFREIRWHLCGTFFWMRNDMIRESDWRSAIRIHRYGVETWPTLVCNGDYDKVTAILPDIDRRDDPYNLENWTQIWNPQIERKLSEFADQ